MTNIMVMFIASISNGLTYTGAIVADNIFWLMPNFSCDFLQYFLNSFSTPTLSDRYVYNGYVFFCDSHSFIICRNSKCKRKRVRDASIYASKKYRSSFYS